MNINTCRSWILLLVFVIGAIVAGLIGNLEVAVLCVFGAIFIGFIIDKDKD